MPARGRQPFLTVRSEGGLLPPDLLQRLASGDSDLPGLSPESYHLGPHERLTEHVARSWTRLLGAWASFRDARARLPGGDPGTTVTRERWLLPLFDELHYGRLQPAPAVEIDGRSYPVSHAWAKVPIHLVGCNVPLDRRTPRVAGAAGQSPHALLQELLNRSEERLWGFVSNGLVLRILRDSSALTRQAYVEVDLEAMMEGQVYPDFVLLWLLCHQSRVEAERPEECWLERWSQEARRRGTRALDSLRAGVERAIAALGRGFLAHPANVELREALRGGELAAGDYYRELLRLVYRLIFLFVAEDRDLLHPPGADARARERYRRFYSSERLRQLAERRRGTRHGDLYQAVCLVFSRLGADAGCPELALPALGGFLFSEEATPRLDRSQVANGDLLDAVRALSFLEEGGVLRAVDYRNLGSEELGSVYESLLELHPELNLEAASFELARAAGHERKTTGSYYTPASLVSSLLDSALEPLLDEAARAADPERALLDLSVCDPACGSGHFLVAAAHRIAKRLASVRTGEEEPAPEALRAALRDVVSRCLYGVDVSPMAVELCKVSLWLEALDPGRPLSFLDAHIRCGNSLLGATPELLSAGIPDEAFKAIEGDDTKVAGALRRRNREERRGQLSLDDFVLDLEARLAEDAAALDAAPDDTIGALREKERRFRSLAESEEYRRSRLLADAWCAAFVQEKTAHGPGITTGLIRRLAESANSLPQETRRAIERLADDFRFFHWHLEFPAVFAGAKGGFDCVLSNPPWERVKLQEKEFFAAHPEIPRARNAAERKRRIAALVQEDPPLYASWLSALRRSEGESHLLRASGRYPLCGRGDVNTYAVFAELMRSLISPTGRVGCIVPSGIATDDTTKHFFRDLVERRSLASLFDLENRASLFPDVDSRVKFCLLTLVGSARPARQAEFVFFAHTVSDLADPDRRFTLAPEDFALLNPNTRTCPIFRSRRDAELTKAIYRRVPVLVEEARGEEGNPWGVRFMAMFHMTNDSHLFHAQPAPGRVPLYEAKMAHQFDHRFATYDGADVRDTTLEEKAACSFAVSPRYWVSEREVDARLAGRWDRGWLLGWRDVTNATNERTVIAAVIPRVAVGNKFPLAILDADPPYVAAFLANLNSFVLDYVARQKVGGTSLNYFILKQLPILPPTAFDRSFRDLIVPRVLELTYTAWDLQPFARDLGYDGPPFRWDAERRFLLRCELDAAFFHLYGLERDDVAYVMDTFPIVRRRDEKACGDYRTKRVILDVYDAMAEAHRTGRPYETRLDPPPADPRVAHPQWASAISSP